MCGLLGAFRCSGFSEEDHAALEKSLGCIAHRGPDHHSHHIFTIDAEVQAEKKPVLHRGELYFGHTRLSILDLSTDANQPFFSSDKKYCIVFNGEIYNYIELRDELTSLGHDFRSQSDTEVLLQAYREWGASSLNRLVGMFAFAVYDLARKEVFAARDQFGIKPFFYSESTADFSFSSELESLLVLPWIDPEINLQKSYDYLQYGSVDGSNETFVAGIKSLHPGHFFTYSLDGENKIFPTRYWSASRSVICEIDFQSAAHKLRALFLESIELHLRSDVPLGAALSGGIDSSAIVCAIREIEPTADIHTFTYVAGDGGKSEEHWADIVGRHVGATMHKVHVQAHELANDIDALTLSQGEPFGSTSIYAQRRVFQLASENGIKVMLDGQGADELFAGYAGYLPAMLASYLSSGQLLAASRFLKSASSYNDVGVKNLLVQALAMIARSIMAERSLRKPNVLPWIQLPTLQRNSLRRTMDRAVYGFSPRRGRFLHDFLVNTVEATSLPALLRYEDRNSMAFSIESRVPFLTPKLAEFVFSLPENYLIDEHGCRKSVLRAALRGLVPDEILDRRDKVGFETPERQWLAKIDRWIADRLDDSDVSELIDTSCFAEEWSSVKNDPSTFDWRIWRTLNYLQWADRISTV